MNWRNNVDDVTKSSIHISEEVGVKTPLAITINELATRLDTAEILFQQLQREVGFQITGSELELYKRAFGNN